MISVKNLHKEFENVTPIKDITVNISKGEVISIIGPSGTGKSTFLRCLNMLETPTSGQIEVDGVDITKADCKLNKIRQKMGMVFQSFNLFSHMNVVDNIMYGPMKLLGYSKEEAYEKAMALLKQVCLADKELAYPHELSGGQKQRIAIARALAMEPEIILFDEPTSALDPTMVGEVLAVIKNLAKEGMTMIIVTHEMRFARDVSTRIFYMDEGTIYEDGTPSQIFDNPQKEKTRQFIRRTKTLERKLSSDQFDFIGLVPEIENFGRKHNLSQRTINRLQTILEELCVQSVMNKLDRDADGRFVIEYSEEDNSVEVHIEYSGAEFNPWDSMDEISKALIDNVINDYRYEYNILNNIYIAVKME